MSEQSSENVLTFLPARLVEQLAGERFRQEAKFPQQHLRNGPVTAGRFDHDTDGIRTIVDSLAGHGHLTWADVLAEEVSEAFDEAWCPGSEQQLRAELIQVAAVCLRWIEDIDRSALACTNGAEEGS